MVTLLRILLRISRPGWSAMIKWIMGQRETFSFRLGEYRSVENLALEKGERVAWEVKAEARLK